MPDRWGRPTFSDGMQIANAFMGLQKFQETQKDRAFKDSVANNVERYMPDEQGNYSNLNPFNYKAKNRSESVAQTAYLDGFRQSEEGQKAIRELKKDKTTKDYSEGVSLLDFFDKAYSSDDEIKKKEAMKAGVEYINAANNPGSAKLNDDGTVNIYRGGKLFKENMDFDGAREMLQGTMSGPAFHQMTVQDEAAVNKKNNFNALNPFIMEKKGSPTIRAQRTEDVAGNVMYTLYDENDNAIEGDYNALKKEGYKVRKPYKQQKDKITKAGKEKTPEDIERSKVELDTKKLTKAKKKMDVLLEAFKGATVTDQYGIETKTAPLNNALDIAERYRDPKQRETLTPAELKKVKHALKAWKLYKQHSEEFGPEVKKQKDWRMHK